jgi:ubiquinone biosynthesis protein
VARRLMRSAHRVVLEHNFFHADPHPANLVVLPDSRVCFIDFGAVGRFSTGTRNIWRELQYHMAGYDVGRMVNCSVRLAGPLPPMDVDAANKGMEEIYADWVRAVRSPDAEWWERSTAQNWLRYVNVANEYGIPVSLETLQFFRATLLYDSIIMRLYKDVDPVCEYKVYAREAAKAARRRVHEAARSRLNGPSRTDQLRFEQFVDAVNQFTFKFQRSAEGPVRRFRNISGKIAYVSSMLLRIAYLTLILWALGLVADICCPQQISWSAILESAASSVWFGIVVLLAAVVIIRRILMRVREPDRQPH